MGIPFWRKYHDILIMVAFFRFKYGFGVLYVLDCV